MKSSLHYLKQLVDERSSVAVLDDFFPNLLTAFRVAEYNWYLEHFPQLNVYSTNPDFKAVHAAYAQLYPQYADRVMQYDAVESLKDCAFVFMNFLNNAYHFLPALTLNCIPFVMTLYPGGGFGLREPESDAKLDQVLSSSLLRGIIATQSVTLDYLKAKGCTVPVYDIFGGTINPIYFAGETKNKRLLLDPTALHICFVAERYMPQGENKGYPQFIEAAQQLILNYPNLRFSVVGSFNAEVYPLDEKISAAIYFHGLLNTTDLKEFFLTQDIIISPNHPFLLHSGNFDGFPTGCCVEASLCGVAVVCSDELKLNRYYTDGLNMVICDPTSYAIVKMVMELIVNLDLLKSIGTRGKIISQKIFDPRKQLGQRSTLLGKAIKHNEVQWAINLVARYKTNIQAIADQARHIHNLEVEMATRGDHIADQARHIHNLEVEMATRGDHIADQARHIHNLEVEMATRGDHIADQARHIHNLEITLMKYQNSLYRKCLSVMSRLYSLMISK
ncbi:glycosyltransferase [Neisseriaceae bacterium TC5R-5]|nr:glycosyltransferase [Neisseriaceae bacterium TC5R-5]